MEIFLPKVLKSVLRHSSLIMLLALSLVGGTGCAGSSLGDSVQQSLEADPRLEDQTVLGGPSSNTDQKSPQESSGTRNSESDVAAADPEARPPEPGNPAFIGPVWSDNGADGDATSATNRSRQAVDIEQDALAKVPEDLQPYVADLMALKLLPDPSNGEGKSGFQPNQPITRGEYAQWLLTANNQFYADQPTKKIRPAPSDSGTAFEDVPPTLPNYGAIQGLAEAGLIPSALTGNATAVNFRPDAPLTRADLVLWKVPLDTRNTLPSATVEAVKETWGFQDASDIDPLALRAVLADYSNGDFANIARAFGYTTLFQPQKAVTQAEAAATLWRFGDQTQGISAAELLNRSANRGSTPVQSETDGP
jgi:hypothetical protein